MKITLILLIAAILVIKSLGLTFHPLIVVFGLLIYVATMNEISDYAKKIKVLPRG